MVTITIRDRIHLFIAWFNRRRWLFGYLIAINVVLLIVGYLLLAQQHNPNFYSTLHYIEPFVVYFSMLRIATEILIYFNWRAFVSWIRKVFNLSIKFTWALLRYRQIFRFVIYLDLAFFMLARYREFLQ